MDNPAYGDTVLDITDDPSTINVLAKSKISIDNDERIIAYSRRKPNFAAGTAMMFVGIVAGIDLFRYFLLTNLAGALLSFTLCTAIVFLGIRLVFYAKRQLVFVTNFRIILSRIDCLGRYAAPCTELKIQDIINAKNLKNASHYLNRKSTGEILIRLISGKSILLPKFYCGDIVAEAINREVSKNK